MTATLQQKSGRPNYYVVVDFNDELTGKRKLKWVTTDVPVQGNNKRRAEAKRKEILTEFEQREVDLGQDVLFTTFLNEWLESMRTSIEPVTYDSYRLIIHNQVIPFYEPKKLKVKDVMPLHIQQYVNFKLKSASPNTVIKH